MALFVDFPRFSETHTSPLGRETFPSYDERDLLASSRAPSPGIMEFFFADGRQAYATDPVDGIDCDPHGGLRGPCKRRRRA